MIARLMRHEEFVAHTLAPTKDDLKLAKSTKDERPETEVSGILKRFDKKKCASDKTTTWNLLKSVHPHAIEYAGRVQRARGMMLTYGLFGVMFGVFFGLMFAQDVFTDGWFSFILSGLIAVPGAFFFALYMLLWTGRFELFCPRDEPILFDRKNRKVYRMFRLQTGGRISHLFRPWPLCAAEHDWDLIDVEHNADLQVTSAAAYRRHALTFLVRASKDDPTIVDIFNVGSPAEMTELTIAPLWEHIRRYMEEEGPALPTGESLYPNEAPGSLAQSFAETGPLSSKYGQWWRDHPIIMVAFHVCFPLFVPLFLLLGIFNWLSNKTAFDVEWPKEVVDAITADFPTIRINP